MRINMMNSIRKRIIPGIVLCTITLLCSCAENSRIQRRHFLLLDSRIIDQIVNAHLMLGTVKKHETNPLFVEDKPWEKRFDNLYGNVMFDEDEKIYKCWYSPFIVDKSAKDMSLSERRNKEYDPPDNREMAICYATSQDGINWVKPELGLVKYNRNTANNILWRGSGGVGEHWHGPHGAGIFKDCFEQDPARLYKALLKGNILSVAFSPDGIHWGRAIGCPEADVAGDTHNNALWAPTLQKYVGFSRSWGEEKGRQVVRIESEDFINWTTAKVVLEGMDKDHQTYAMPVFYYGGVYLGLVAIHEQSSDRVWTELTWSPDTKQWYRISPGTPLIPNSETVLDYDYGCIYACAYPVFLKDEIRLYYGGSDYLHYGWRNGSLCLATLRPDGFAGYEPKEHNKSAVIVTKLIPYSGQNIGISADVELGGSVKVSVLDQAGAKISSAQIILQSVTDGILRFPESIEQNQIKLEFELDRAKLYSFTWVDGKK